MIAGTQQPAFVPPPGASDPWWWLVAFGLAGALLLWVTLCWYRRRHEVRALTDILRWMSEGALSESQARQFESQGARGRFMADTVRLLLDRDASAQQSEQLLHALIDAAPMAILLIREDGEIEYTNQTALDLFFDGRQVDRANFLVLLSKAPAPLREAVLDQQDSLFTVEIDGSSEAYHLSKRPFVLRGATHTLLTVKHLTKELRRQEIQVWKKLIRVLSHELNNSLAPITSLVHSARTLTHAAENPKLDRVYTTIEERARHLQAFVEGYARFARLPKPRKERVVLQGFAEHVRGLAPYATLSVAELGPPHFDRMQLEQVVINLLKNAFEAGGPPEAITLRLQSDEEGQVTIQVTDRGPGMSEQVLSHALLPFYSTKEQGTGLGLALCREIIEAHGGSIRLENRTDGGLAVTCTVPGLEQRPPPSSAKLTLSRL